MPTEVAVVASGATVSSVVATRGGDIGILSPFAVDSCVAFLQVATTTTSADFRRARIATSTTSEWSWPVNSAASAVSVPADAAGIFPFFRLETSVAQTSARSFSIAQTRSR